MMGRLSLIAAMIGSICLATPAAGQQPPPAASKPVEIDRSTQTEEVKFRSELNERMTVPVILSGTGPYRFMVDTGADRTAVSREIAERLKLAPGTDASLHSVVGVSPVTTTMVPDLKLSRKSVKIDNAPMLEARNMGADGILGVDSLASQRVQFDFANSTMSIVPSSVREEPVEEDAIVIVATRRKGRLIFTDARINGRSVTVVLDTGSQVSIGNQALRKALRRRDVDDTQQTVQLQSVTGGTLDGSYTFVRELEMGGVSLNNLAVVFADAHTFRKLGIDDRPALLLGMNAFRAFKKVSIDFATRKFRVVVPESSSLDTRTAGRFGTAGRIAMRDY